MSDLFPGILQVWNWLYLEEEGQGKEAEEEEEEEAEGDRGVSVQFSPAEFLQVIIFSFLKAPTGQILPCCEVASGRVCLFSAFFNL